MADGAHTRQMTLQEMAQQLDEMRTQQSELKGEIGDKFSEMKSDLLGILKQALKLPEQAVVASPSASSELDGIFESLESSWTKTLSQGSWNFREPETMKKYDPFVEPLKDDSALQVVGSISDVLLVHKVDSHVKEVEESPQKSTSGTGENVAHQLFDEKPVRVSNKEVLSFSYKDDRVWEPGGVPNKMDLWDWPKGDSKPHRKKSHQIETFEALNIFLTNMSYHLASHVRQSDVTTVADAVWIAKHCESSLLQHSSATQNRAPFSPYQNYNDQPYYEREFGKCPEIEFDRESDEIKDEKLQNKQPEEDVKTLVMSSLLNVLVMSLPMMRNQVPFSSMEPSPRYLKESLVVVSDMSYDLGCVISKANGCICDSELGQANFHDEKEFKGLNLGKLLRDEWLLSIVCLLGLHDMSCWTQLLRQQIFPKSWRFKFKTESSADYRKLNLWVNTNYCELRPDRTHVKLQEMSYFLSEKSLAEFVGYKAHGRDLLVEGVKQFTLAATKFHLKHKWRSKFGSNKPTRTWTSYSGYDSSSCALRQEENYVLVLSIIIEALTLFNDQHTLVAEKNGTETSIVLKLIFGTSQDYYLLLFLERVKATFEIMLTVEHFENPLITILSYEWFHSPRPPELSCCKEDEESTAKITSLRPRMLSRRE